MNADILRGAGVDYDRGVKRFLGRAHLFEKALSKFLKDGTFDRLRADYAAGDREKLFADAHEFKGMCGNIGLESLYVSSSAVVEILRNGGDLSELRPAFEGLETEYGIVYGAIIAAGEGAL